MAPSALAQPYGLGRCPHPSASSSASSVAGRGPEAGRLAGWRGRRAWGRGVIRSPTPQSIALLHKALLEP
eukprot:scaffold1241_cov32-Prasinocladus_malaysianus.AAC.1